ncbi:MAG: class II poly(R)-hydroxyalkanoic acid synthase, partial [Pseudomonas caspiana]
PGNPKARYMTNSELPVDPKVWQENGTKHTDSWWLHWQNWLSERSGKLKKSPATLGSKAFPAGEASPGTYVHER